MNIVYNNFDDVANNLRLFFSNNTSCLHKPQLNFLPEVICSMILKESLVAFDIAKNLKGKFSFVQTESIEKRIRRLMKNPRFKAHSLFDQTVNFIIDNLKLKHSDKRVHIIIDHMYSKENYTILMASMRVGSQGIPIAFKSFVGFNNSEAYLDSLLIDMVFHIDNIFKNKDFELIFLADRWFNSHLLLKTIQDLGHTYCIRLKGNININIFDNKEGHVIKKQTGDLFAYQFHSAFYENVELYEEYKFNTTIVISKRKDVYEPWLIATNGNPKRAIKDYGYRFGGIETIFKSEKSNCFYLEDIVNASSLYFENLFSTLCICILLCTCLGVEYSKNSGCYKNIKLRTHKNKTKTKRNKSIFKTGLDLFQIAIDSRIYIRLPIRFILYDM